MAKIGNEAKLILKLAREKSSTEKEYRVRALSVPLEYQNGYKKCYEDIWVIIDQIVAEVEGK